MILKYYITKTKRQQKNWLNVSSVSLLNCFEKNQKKKTHRLLLQAIEKKKTSLTAKSGNNKMSEQDNILSAQVIIFFAQLN